MTHIQNLLGWIIEYIIKENFGERHLTALMHIIGLFNDCAEAEAEIFAFADALYKKYAE